MENLKELSITELATQLILKRQEAKAVEQYTKDIQDELLNRDFEKETIEGITVSRKSRKSISLLPEVDLVEIKERYPDLVSVKNVLDVKKSWWRTYGSYQRKSTWCYYTRIWC